MSVELQVRFPVDDTELSALHHRAFSPDRPEPDTAIRPWAHRLERHSLTWVGAFSAGRLVGFVHAIWDGGTHAFILDGHLGHRPRTRPVTYASDPKRLLSPTPSTPIGAVAGATDRI
jgi:hypothetical protein